MKIDIEKHMRDQQIKEIIKNYYKDTDVVVTLRMTSTYTLLRVPMVS